MERVEEEDFLDDIRSDEPGFTYVLSCNTDNAMVVDTRSIFRAVSTMAMAMALRSRVNRDNLPTLSMWSYI